MTTNYETFDPNTSTYKDLSDIFLSITSGTPSSITTNYKISNGNDLNLIFASINSLGGSDIGFDTGYDVSGTDLRYIFASINSKQLFNSTSGLISTNKNNDKSGTLATNFYLPTGYTYFNFVIYGGGGTGGYPTGSGYGSGGGGSGATIISYQIPYSSNNIIINNITYKISGANVGSTTITYINVKYSNGDTISLNCGNGQSLKYGSGSTGGSGGISSFSTISFYSSTNITSINGANGGNQGHNGSSNGYTSSGSGAIGDTSTSIPYGTPPSVSKIYNTPDGETYTLQSRGGGKNQTVIGYGAGGASCPTNYNQNTSAYAQGLPGAILYYLSS